MREPVGTTTCDGASASSARRCRQSSSDGERVRQIRPVREPRVVERRRATAASHSSSRAASASSDTSGQSVVVRGDERHPLPDSRDAVRPRQRRRFRAAESRRAARADRDLPRVRRSTTRAARSRRVVRRAAPARRPWRRRIPPTRRSRSGRRTVAARRPHRSRRPETPAPPVCGRRAAPRR